jgi:Fe-S-cluster containining protein
MSPTRPENDADTEAPWYRDGLSFECTRCGACCTGAPGYVWVIAEEIARLAEFRGETVEQFSRRFVRRVGSRYSLVEKPGGDCIFWDRQVGCTVYPARPVQCQTWPFWPENVESPEAWEHVEGVCPGSGRGRWFSVEEIRAAAARVHTV